MDYPQTLWFCIFIFLIPTLWPNDIPPNKVIRSFLKMFLFGCLSVFLSTLWFASTFPLDWLKISDPVLSIIIIGGLWLGFILVFALPIAFWGIITSFLYTRNFFFNAILGSCTWVVIEYARSWLIALATYGNETLFGPHHTYYSLGYTIAHAPVFRELLPIGGLWLGSFFIILVNYSIYHIITNRKNFFHKKEILSPMLLASGILLVGVMTMHLTRSSGAKQQSIPVTIINSNFPSATDKQDQVEKGRLAYALLDQIPQQSKIVVFPENFNILAFYQENKKTLPSEPIIMGSFSGKNSYNLFFLNTKNGTIEYSKKQLLMPIGEYSVSWLRMFIQSTGNEKWLALYDAPPHTAKRGTGRHLFSDPSISETTIGGSLCSENISPAIYRGMTRNGATLLVNTASLGPFHGSVLLERQTLAINTVRALENGRYFITASNRGGSFVITDNGNIQAQSPRRYKESFFIANANIQAMHYITPYVHFGDFMIPVSFAIVLISAIWRRNTPLS